MGPQLCSPKMNGTSAKSKALGEFNWPVQPRETSDENSIPSTRVVPSLPECVCVKLRWCALTYNYVIVPYF